MNEFDASTTDHALRATIRRQARERRRAQPDKDRLSRLILDQVERLPEYQQARTVVFYVGVRDEVRTLPHLWQAVKEKARLVVPWCCEQGLSLTQICQSSDLVPGRFGIPEPHSDLRQDAARTINPRDVDFVLVPGVAFDEAGGRLGHGQGYYDRLLSHMLPTSLLCGLAYECQLVSRLPLEPHDVRMHLIVTEERIVHCRAGCRD